MGDDEYAWLFHGITDVLSEGLNGYRRTQKRIDEITKENDDRAMKQTEAFEQRRAETRSHIERIRDIIRPKQPQEEQ